MAYHFRAICRKCSIIGAAMLLLQSAKAQQVHPVSGYDFSKTDTWLMNNLDELGGRAVMVIYKDGKLIYTHAINDLSNRHKIILKAIARRQGLDPDLALKEFGTTTKERIASCSKWLSAALIMTFIDEGSLQLEDTVGKFLPVLTANGKGNITIWQCLSHLTGIKAGTVRETNEAMKDMQSMDEAIALIAKQPMEGLPGKTFHYSNAGLQIAAGVIEKISGKSFETLFAQRIAIPCQMINTDFGHGKVALPSGGAWSTADDYIKFLSMILNEGKYNAVQVLSKNAIIEMQKNRVSKDAYIAYTPAEAGNWGYGFGEWIMDDFDKLNLTNSYGQRSEAVTSPGLFGSFPWIDRKLNYAGFLFSFNINSKGRNDRYRQLKKTIDEVLNK